MPPLERKLISPQRFEMSVTTAKQMFKYLERSSHLVGEKSFREKTDAAGQVVIPFSPTEYGMHEVES